MIEVKITGLKLVNDKIKAVPSFVLDVEGHSFLDESGKDIVCAAVSALTQTTVKSISLIAGIKQEIEQNPGKLYTDINLTDVPENNLEKLQTIIEMFLIGLNEIKMKYPDRIKILAD